jgi:hypothetical protein
MREGLKRIYKGRKEGESRKGRKGEKGWTREQVKRGMEEEGGKLREGTEEEKEWRDERKGAGDGSIDLRF